MADPIHQFEIKELIPLEIFETNISYTNSSLFMSLAIIFVTLLLLLSIKNKSLIPSRFQSISEIFYESKNGQSFDKKKDEFYKNNKKKSLNTSSSHLANFG